jgi:hypothetical protein
MNDLKKRLRNYERMTAAKDMVEAAVRIEALEAALREIEDCLDYVKDKGVVWKIARAALDKDTNE